MKSDLADLRKKYLRMRYLQDRSFLKKYSLSSDLLILTFSQRISIRNLFISWHPDPRAFARNMQNRLDYGVIEHLASLHPLENLSLEWLSKKLITLLEILRFRIFYQLKFQTD
ncbi:hypothetical protein PUN28_003661 [Cardiocondyla obscurior]|uniref:Uncharacterized protein n=1 Tax=Cardiocondyla obscurior TaxID=286306 RepID=A0AAW2GMF8_9HYME